MNFKALLFPEDYFQWLLRFFRLSGLYPPKDHKWKLIYCMVSLPHVALSLTSIILGFLNILLNEENFERKMLNSGVLFMHTAGGLRILRWLSTTNKVEEVVAIIQRPDFEFTIYNYNGRGNTAKLKRTPIDEFKDIRLRRTNSICSSIFLLVSSYVLLNILITYCYNLSKPTYAKFNHRLNRTSVYRDLPYPMWFPFDVSLSDGYYLLAFFYQFYAYCSLVVSFWYVEWVVLSSIIHLQNQLTVVTFALGEVDKDIAQVGTGKISLTRKIRLVKCVQELGEIFRAADLIEKFYNKQLLIQNTLAIFSFCSLLYVISTLTVPTEISYLSTAVGIILLQPFFQCWICQNFTIGVSLSRIQMYFGSLMGHCGSKTVPRRSLVELKFSTVLGQIYELDWIEYPPDLRRALIMTMMRLQKPTVFTLGKWRPMDVSFYIYLLKMTYSFYTLISQTRRNK